MSNIRTTYAGLLSFGVGISGIITGFIFTLIVTRQLTAEEFGTLSLIEGLMAYVFIVDPIISFWTTREIARGEKSGKTALVTSGIFSTAAIPAYIAIVILSMSQIDVNTEILIFATLLIPVRFVKNILAAINLGYKPQTTSFALFIFEISKIGVALFLVYFLDMGIEGIILSLVIASLASIIFSLIKSYEQIKVKFQKEKIKKWFHLFWLPIYPKISQIMLSSDVVIFTLIVGTVESVAYWGVSVVISQIVLNAAKINKAIYPKLLGGGQKEFLQENLIRVFYFAFPLLAMCITLAKPTLFIFNPIYEIAVPIVIILSISYFLRSLENVFSITLQGLEKVDVGNPSFKEYIRSRLFILPTLRIIHRISYLIILGIILFILKSNDMKDFDLVVYWSLISLVTQIPYVAYLYIIVKKEFKLKIPSIPIVKYIIVSTISFVFTSYVIQQFVDFEKEIFEFVPIFFIIVGGGVGLYLSLTYLWDKRTKRLFKAVIKEIRG